MIWGAGARRGRPRGRRRLPVRGDGAGASPADIVKTASTPDSLLTYT